MPYRDKEHRAAYQRLYYQRRKKSHRVIRVTGPAQQYEEFKAYAERNHETVSKLVGRLAVSAMSDIKELSPKTRKAVADLIYQIRAIGNNVNQLSHAANIAVLKELPLTPSEGARQLHSVHEELVQLEMLIREKL